MDSNITFNDVYNNFVKTLPYELYPHQKEAIESYYNSKNGIIMVANTGAGKTDVAEFAIHDSIFNRGVKVMALFPYKALTNEKLTKWEKVYKTQRDTGDDSRTRRDSGGEYHYDFDVLLTTYERSLAIIKNKKLSDEIFNQIGLVVIDEVHMLGDRDRGLKLEVLVVGIKNNYPHIRFCCLSATLSNYKQLANWLDLGYSYSDFRPVKLVQHFLPEVTEFRRAAQKYEKQEILADILIEHKKNNWQTLIFVSAISFAKEIADLGGFGVIKCHYAGLRPDEKQEIEDDFLKGKVDIIVSTPTLAAGINLPAHAVVVLDASFWLDDVVSGAKGWRLWPSTMLHQMVGRAGRPGMVDEGHFYIVGNENEVYNTKKILETLPRCDSKILDDPALAILIAIKEGYHDSETIYSFLKGTFGYFQHSNAISEERFVSETISKLTPLFIKETDDGDYSLTATGSKVATFQVNPLDFKFYYNKIEDFNFSTPYNNEFNYKLWEMLMTVSGKSSNGCSPLHKVFGTCPICRSFSMQTKFSQKYGKDLSDVFVRFWEILETTSKFLRNKFKKKNKHEGKIFVSQLCNANLDRDVAALTIIKGIGPVQGKKLRDMGFTVSVIASMTSDGLIATECLRTKNSTKVGEYIESARQIKKEIEG